MRVFQNIHTYKKLDEISIKLFWEITESGNYFMLDKEYFEGKKYGEKNIKKLSDLWIKLNDDYFLIQNDNGQKNTIRNSIDLVRLQLRYVTALNTFDFYAKLSQYEELLGTKAFIEKEQELLKMFFSLGMKGKLEDFKFNSIIENLIKVKKFIEAIGNKMKMLSEENKKEGKQIKESIYNQLVDIEGVLGRSLGKLEDINVIQWNAYINQAKEKIKALEKQNAKG